MREILFRAKSVWGDWCEGLLVKTGDHFRISMQNDFISVGCIPDTVGQFTGLTDKNGKKIFEGDIVTFRTRTSTFKPLYVRWYDETAQFLVTTNDCVRSYPMDRSWQYEVIGNIHDNPELLDVHG